MSRRRAFSLIELIAVLAVVAILAAVTLSVLLRELDLAAESAEDANLQKLAGAFQAGAMKQRYLPSTADWGTFIATNAGWQTSAVLTNARNNARSFLVDPALTLTLPYQQTNTGVNANQLANGPRFILVSSLSGPLPNLAGADFNALWTNSVNTIPATATWSSWHGQGADLRIQRVNLASSFKHLVLNNADTTNAPYSIDNSATNWVATSSVFDAYFLASTVFNLYFMSNTIPVLEASQVLQQDTSWNFSSRAWRNASVPAPSSGGGGGDLESIIETFLSNPAHNGITTAQLYNDMTNWMAGYNQWKVGGFTDVNLQKSLNHNGTAYNGIFYGKTLYTDYTTMDAH